MIGWYIASAGVHTTCYRHSKYVGRLYGRCAWLDDGGRFADGHFRCPGSVRTEMKLRGTFTRYQGLSYSVGLSYMMLSWCCDEWLALVEYSMWEDDALSRGNAQSHATERGTRVTRVGGADWSSRQWSTMYGQLSMLHSKKYTNMVKVSVFLLVCYNVVCLLLWLNILWRLKWRWTRAGIWNNI